MRNVFVLTTGRSGSVTLARALEHVSNFTVAHESRAGQVVGRLDYPAGHIEVDNRLSWFLGPLADRFGDDAVYVHLTRDPVAVAASFAARWALPLHAYWRSPRRLLSTARARASADVAAGGIMGAFAYGMVMRSRYASVDERGAAARLLVDTMESNIRAFLATRAHTCTVRLEHAAEDLPGMWERCGFEGDLDRALGVMGVRHNATRDRRHAASA